MATAFEEVTHAGPDVLKQCEWPPLTFSGETVWIGFMDIVPVIGTLRESVELVLALYEGNEAVVKEKEMAIENTVKGSSQKHKVTVPDKPAEDEYSGLRNVREVRMGMIIEYMAKGSKRGTITLTPAEKEKRIEAINKSMLEKLDELKKIREFEQKYIHYLKEELRRSGRGEHVFNNDILKFHSKVLKEFIQKMNIHTLREYNEQEVNELGRHTLPLNTAEDIETNMVVQFDEHEFYVNVNAMLYGVFCEALHGAMLDVLSCINPEGVKEEDRQDVNKIIDFMNDNEIYVDQLAKEKWLLQDRRGIRESRLKRFKEVRQDVVKMYKTVRGVEWCIDIMEKVAPWFIT